MWVCACLCAENNKIGTLKKLNCPVPTVHAEENKYYSIFHNKYTFCINYLYAGAGQLIEILPKSQCGQMLYCRSGNFFWTKVKVVTKHFHLLTLMVLMRCPGLQIVFSTWKKMLFGADPNKNHNHLAGSSVKIKIMTQKIKFLQKS